MSADGTGRCPVTGRARLGRPIGSPDGQRIAFIAEDERERGLSWMEVVNADGSQSLRITPRSLNVHWWFRNLSDPLLWSPDGERLILAAQSVESQEDALHIWSDAAGLQRVPNSDGALAGSWSPDGAYLIFLTVSPKEGNYVALHVIRPDGSGRRLLADDVTNAQSWISIAWMPDGDIAYINNGDPNALILLDPATGQQRGQIALVRLSYRYALSPDGAQLAMLEVNADAQGDDELGFSVATLDIRSASSDAEARVVMRTGDADLFQGIIAWSADGMYLLYRGTDGHIQRVSKEGGSPVRLDYATYFTVWQRR